MHVLLRVLHTHTDKEEHAKNGHRSQGGEDGRSIFFHLVEALSGERDDAGSSRSNGRQ